ncbi:MAG: serine protease [Myxococcales bacterium]|nr:serine protease [Myxococcales bacterium]
MLAMIGVTMLAVASAAAPDQWLDAVVLVRQGSTTCAGVLVAQTDQVATAYHCVASGGRPQVQTRDGSSVVGRVSAVDVASDLALVTLPDDAPIALGLPLAETWAVGDRIWALGHPLASDPPGGFFEGTLRWSATQGIVSATGSRSVQFDAAVNPGNSGGPLVDAAGSIVGIVSRRAIGRGVAFAGHSDALRALLQEEPSPAGLGGTLGAEVGLTSLDSAVGGLSVGATAVLAIRDRVVASLSGSAPLSPRWRALRFGTSEGVVGSARLGLRQRLGRGSFAVRIDAWAGVAAVSTVRIEDVQLQSRSLDLRPGAGLSLRVRGVAFHAGLLVQPDGRITSTSGASLGWPGVVGVF